MRVLGEPYGPEPHNGLLYGYEGTNITWEKTVKGARTQLIDALSAFGRLDAHLREKQRPLVDRRFSYF